jgi:hypothetical protein
MRGLIWCTQSSESAMGNWALYQRKEPQVPSLRFAPVGMTILLCTQKLQRDIHDPAMKLSSRPEQLWAFGPPEVIKNGFCSATILNGSAALPFVISTGAPKERSGEICGPAVPSWKCFSTEPTRISYLAMPATTTGARLFRPYGTAMVATIFRP